MEKKEPEVYIFDSFDIHGKTINPHGFHGFNIEQPLKDNLRFKITIETISVDSIQCETSKQKE
jgi:hypothetical protein